MALRWDVRKSGQRLRLDDKRLSTADAWSDAWAVNADGSVIVGDSGPSDTELQATRWVNGTRQALEVVSTSSTARFTSSDGSTAAGLATIGSRKVLVFWDGNGSATVAEPPAGASIETIAAINPAGTAAVGALSVGGNRAPYLWTRSGGFTVIPENGREQDYDLSEALDVSDDGTVVVGALQASVVSNGDPAPRGFLWTRGPGPDPPRRSADRVRRREPEHLPGVRDLGEREADSRAGVVPARESGHHQPRHRVERSLIGTIEIRS